MDFKLAMLVIEALN